MALRCHDASASAEALDVNPVGDVEDLRHVVADQDDGEPPFPQVADEP